MIKFSLVMLLMMSATTLIGQKNSSVIDPRLTGLDTELEKLLKDWKIAGFAVAVVEKNKLIYSKGFGYRDMENKKPVSPNTLFAIGSCSKAFTSAVLGQLEKEGKLDLDKPAITYIPYLKFFNNEMNEKITARDMMCHRTGLSRHDFSWYLFNTNSRDSMLMRVQYQEPNAGIREKWQYNNFMFLAQGVLAEKLTGKTWEENIKQRFFDSLGMVRSNFSIEELVKDTNHAVGYTIEKDSIIKKTDYYHIMGMSPAGSINSSVSEMANWVIAWINGGKYAGKEILPSAYVQSAISSQMVSSGGVPDKEHPDIHFSNYGLAWFLASYRGHYRVEHGGNIDGFSASTCFFPSDSIGIIVLTNQNGSAVPSVARNIVADRMLKLSYINWSNDRKQAVDKAIAQQKESEKSVVSNRIAGTKPSHPLSDYEGTFFHPGYGEIATFVKNDSLFGRTPKEIFWLRHYHYDVFEVKNIDKTAGPDTSSGGIHFNFRTGDAGKIESISIPFETTIKPLEFAYKPRIKALSKDELEKYTGEYELPGIIAKVYLKGTTLFVLVPGQPEYETISIGAHSFKLKSLDGYSLKFEVSEKNEVTAVSFTQPNGTFKAPRKK
jgi:CubicO group peptidase (beta-lactamase class C family)